MMIFSSQELDSNRWIEEDTFEHWPMIEEHFVDINISVYHQAITGIAVNIESATTMAQITKYLKEKVCMAWESKTDQGIGMINCAVGGGI